MFTKLLSRTNLSIFLLVLTVFLFIATDILEAKKGGGSFGGRRSTGRSYSRTPRTTSPPRSSFGNRRTTTPKPVQRNQTSFGGTRMNSAKEYTSKYGVPRKSIQGSNIKGVPGNYRVMDYGGYGSGLMTGYVMGHSTFMWSMPFHPAFYYTKPYYVTNKDGTVSVYPPTFSVSKVIVTVLMAGGGIFFVYHLIRRRRLRRQAAYSGGSGDMSKSSFS